MAVSLTDHEQASIRRFTAPVPEELILKVLEAGRWAPSGENE